MGLTFEPSQTASECFPYCSMIGRIPVVTMRCARLKLWSISAVVSCVGGASQALFTLEGQCDGLLQLLQFLGERQVAIRGHTLARHLCVLVRCMRWGRVIVVDALGCLQGTRTCSERIQVPRRKGAWHLRFARNPQLHHGLLTRGRLVPAPSFMRPEPHIV